MTMKKAFLFSLVLLVTLTGCRTTEQGAVNGAYFGSALGSVIGSILGGSNGHNIGSVVGVVAGGATGAAIGHRNERSASRRGSTNLKYQQQERTTVGNLAPKNNYAATLPAENHALVIAHRGEWKSQGSAQNSRASLQRAMALDIWGTEIDVWITQDNHVMVNHDASYNGITIENATYQECKRLQLANGEKMPELSDLLKLMKRDKGNTRLVLEVKSHKDVQRSAACAVAAVQAVKKAKLQERTVYISFSLEACVAIHKADPQAEVAYLNGDRSPMSLQKLGLTGIDYNIKAIRQHPEWVEEAHNLGMNVNVWTVDNEQEWMEMDRLGVDFITTNEPARCELFLGGQK